MKINLVLLTLYLLGISFTSCDNKTNKESNSQQQDTLINNKSNLRKVTFQSLKSLQQTFLGQSIFTKQFWTSKLRK